MKHMLSPFTPLIPAALLLASLLLAATLLPGSASAQQAPSDLALTARSYVLYDYTSNQILLSKNANTRVEPASLTKLMTAYLTFAALKQGKLTLNQSLTPSADVLRTLGEESRMFLQAGKQVSVMELVHGLIVQSGNDASRTLAIAIAGDENTFVAMMNKEAQRLGMKDTHFVNSTGMPHPQHYSSAYDLALVSAATVRDFPEYYALYSLRSYQYNNIKQENRNRLLWMDPNVDGMKTGHAESAGFCLVASAKRNKRRLISVLLGATSDSLRSTESQKLLNYGFQYFDTVRLYQKNQMATSLRLWKGTENKLDVGFLDDLYLSVPSGQLAQLKATIESQQPLMAPIASGQKIATMKLTLNGKPFGEFPLVALEAVPLANVFSRGWDNIRLFFQ